MATRKLLGLLSLGLSVFLFGASATVGSHPEPMSGRAAVSSGLLAGGVATMAVAWRGFRQGGSSEG